MQLQRRLLFAAVRGRGRRAAHLPERRWLFFRWTAVFARRRVLRARLRHERRVWRARMRAGGRRLSGRARLLRWRVHGRALRGDGDDDAAQLPRRWRSVRRPRRLLRPAVQRRAGHRHAALPALALLSRRWRELRYRQRLLQRPVRGDAWRCRHLQGAARLQGRERALHGRQGLLRRPLRRGHQRRLALRRARRLPSRQRALRRRRELLFGHVHGRARRSGALRARPGTLRSARRAVHEGDGLLRRGPRLVPRRSHRDPALPGRRSVRLRRGRSGVRGVRAMLQPVLPRRRHRRAHLSRHLRAAGLRLRRRR